jgi:energy-coupling factor transporter ATP-binding protein EcfA2
MRIHGSIDTQYEFVNLGKSQTAIIGKNGTGKTTFLKEMAKTILPGMGIDRGHTYWSGGFVFKPEGPKDGFHSITLKGAKFGGSFEDYQWKSGWSIDQEHLNEYMVQEQVLPDRTRISRILHAEGLRWEQEWDPILEREISLQNTFVYLCHPWRVDGFYDALENPYTPKNIVLRLLRINEDTPHAVNKRAEIIDALSGIANEHGKQISYLDRSTGESKIHINKLDYKEFLHKASYGEKYGEQKYESLFENPLFTPFLMSWSVLDRDWDINKFCETMAVQLPHEFLEWPRRVFQGPRDHLIMCLADPHLVEKKGLSDLDLLARSSQLDGLRYSTSPFPKVDRGEKYVNDTLEPLIEKASELLKNWEIVPRWERTYTHNGETHTSEFGYSFSFHEGNLSYWKFHDDPPNTTTKRWILRALQIAALMDVETGSPYKLAIWDEPELGLHPTAIELIRDRIFPFLENHGIKLIFTTHSIVLANSASTILKSSWKENYQGPDRPEIEELPYIEEDHLNEIGLTKIDLLGSIKNFLILEGAHDRVVFETLFRDELKSKGTKILTLEGTENLFTLPQSEVLYNYFEAQFTIVVDGKKRSQLTEKDPDYFALINEACADSDVKRCLELATDLQKRMEARKVEDHVEGVKLVELIFKWAKLAASGKADISRLRFVMLSEGDIIHYLNPGLVFSKQTDLGWKELRAKYHRRQDKTLSEKNFYRFVLGANISIHSIRLAASRLLDSAIPADFEQVLEVLK